MFSFFFTKRDQMAKRPEDPKEQEIFGYFVWEKPMTDGQCAVGVD
jgi:hypothetical protein